MTRRKEKRLALAVSLVLHGVVFVCLAAFGVFSFLQHREVPQVTDVTLYDDDATGPAMTAAGGGSSGGDAGMTVNVPSDTTLPPVDESYTTEVEKEKKIQQLAAEKGLSPEEAKQLVNQTSSSGPSAGNSTSTGNGDGTDAGNGTDSGNGDGRSSGNGDGNSSSHSGRRPAQRAHLISSPSFVVPQGARKNLHGNVTLSIVISADGSVTSATVVSNSTGSSEIESAALQFAYSLQYEPAINDNGDAVATTKTIPINF